MIQKWYNLLNVLRGYNMDAATRIKELRSSVDITTKNSLNIQEFQSEH